MTKAQLKKVDARVSQAYKVVGNCVEIDMMDIPRVFAVGRAAVEAGADDEALKAKLGEFVNSIRKN